MVSKRIGYTISVVARTYGVHPQTLRSYERRGLLTPSRSSGNTRLYTEKDLLRLEIILNLTRELGVNLAGVEVILNMREKMVRMQDEVGQLFEFLKTRFDLDPDLFRDRFREALVPSPPSKLVQSSKPGVDRQNT
jgi:MerR family transcriptional regulator/heat shock protein HspR